MKVGDLIKIPPCDPMPDEWESHCCPCFFCSRKSSRIGIVVSKSPHSRKRWRTIFDCGEWDLLDDEGEIISEGR